LDAKNKWQEQRRALEKKRKPFDTINGFA